MPAIFETIKNKDTFQFNDYLLKTETAIRIIILSLQSLEPATTSANSYVESSAFRQEDIVKTTTEASIPIHPLQQPPVVSSPLAIQPEGLGQEFDKAYFSTLDVFVHDF